VIGLLNVTRALLPVLHRQGNGHVINISSIGGYQAYDGIIVLVRSLTGDYPKARAYSRPG
jgi:NADP-dependent 3-hydroxy acid dehydrogenase YdfG